MTHSTRRTLVLTMLLVTFVAAACGPAGSSVTPPASAASAAPSPSPSAAPSAIPAPSSTATPTAAPTASPAATPVACVVPQTGTLPSDRLTGIKVTAGATSDSLTFRFGNPSLGPAGVPQGSIQAAEPPYTQAGSGATIAVEGDHVLQMRFERMSLSNDAGQETYTGPTEIKPDLQGLRHAVEYDASEGVIGWYVGYNGNGCVTLVTTGNDVTLTIPHA